MSGQYAETTRRFHDKVKASWRGYRANLLTLPKEDLLEKAEEIAAMKFCRDTDRQCGFTG